MLTSIKKERKMKGNQIVLNLFANTVSVLVGLMTSFLLTPYIVNSIGKEAYSFIPISSNLTSYMAIFTVALTSMAARFITLKVHRNELNSASRYYSTSIISNLIASMGVFFISVLAIIYIDKIVNIPVEIFSDVRMLFIYSFLAFIINLSTSSFSVAQFSTNRIDVTSIISILGSIIRSVTIVVLFVCFEPKVNYIGLSILLSVSVQSLLNVLLSKKLMPSLKISHSLYDIKIAFELIKSGLWNSLNQLSSVLLTGVDLVIANLALGPVSAGILSISKTAPMAIQTLIGIVPSTFNPHLTISYAKESHEDFIKELFFVLRSTSIITAIPIAGFIVLSQPFFMLWVPNDANKQLTILAVLTSISLLASFSIMPLHYIFTITNKLKWPSFAVLITGVLNIIIVYIVIEIAGLGIYAIAGVSGLLELIRCLIFIPMYSAYCLKEKPTYFYPYVIKSLLYMTILLMVYFLLSILIVVKSWIMLMILVVIFVIVGFTIGFLVLLSKNDMLVILSKLHLVKSH